MINQENNTKYSTWLNPILRPIVFRFTLGKDSFFGTCVYAINFFKNICGQYPCGIDPVIADRSRNRFVSLGAQCRFVMPRDGNGCIQMMTFKSSDLENKINHLGGKWERIFVNDQETLAIIPPPNPREAWRSFKEELSHFRWKEEDGIIITCDFADAIPTEHQKQCFLYAHTPNYSFTSEWEKAGFYLGAKQDICFFDNGNIWENEWRPVSEESFYLEIDAVYENIKDDYKVQDLWVGGGCGGGPVAAYLKQRLHGEGVNFFVESSFPDIADFNVDAFTKPLEFTKFFAPYIKGCLSIPLEMDDSPPACQFSVERLWQDLPKNDEGKIILIQVQDDEHISNEASERYLHLAQKVNAKVEHILFTSELQWRHSDSFYHYSLERRKFFQYVFNTETT